MREFLFWNESGQEEKKENTSFKKAVKSVQENFKNQLKGELTIVISEKKGRKKSSQELSESDKRIIKNMISKLSIKEITNLIHSNNNVSKKKIYNYCLELKNEN